ncbi:MAG: UbiA-like polyprenyltransferase [Acidobacteriota bacterium]|jgi:4-hydroxybenzoate polyprenyltransferase
MPGGSVLRKLLIVLEMIKIEHTVFALPFAYLGAFLGVRGFPGWNRSFWILVAMVGARSAAMGFNRLVDMRIDAQNPRTSGRALPRGLVSTGFVATFVIASAGLLFLAGWMLNPLSLELVPIALVIVLGYSYTKRFTSLSHLFLGLALGIAPIGGWVAVRGELSWEPWLLSAAVLLWVAGFDIIYSCQDVGFDQDVGLYSFPSRLGVRRALWLSSLFHVGMLGVLIWVFFLFRLSWLSWMGLLLVAITLIYEHRLVRPDDLSRVNAAFFTLNGLVSILLLLFVGLDLCLVV